MRESIFNKSNLFRFSVVKRVFSDWVHNELKLIHLVHYSIISLKCYELIVNMRASHPLAIFFTHVHSPQYRGSIFLRSFTYTSKQIQNYTELRQSQLQAQVIESCIWSQNIQSSNFIRNILFPRWNSLSLIESSYPWTPQSLLSSFPRAYPLIELQYVLLHWI